MKVLLVNCVYGHGSTGKIMHDLKNGLERLNCQVYIAYGRGLNAHRPGIFKLCPNLLMKMQSVYSKITGFSYGGSPFSTYRLKKIITQVNPDVVNLHCINANTINVPDIIRWLRDKNIATVITEHAEFLHTGGCGHAMDCEKWKNECGKCPQFHKEDSNLPISYFFDTTNRYWHQLQKSYKGFTKLIITGVSPWLCNRSKLSPLMKDKEVHPVLNGLDCTIFTPRELTIDKCKLLFGEKKLIVHITPDFYSPIKGGKYVLEVAKEYALHNPEVLFCIVGYNGDGNDLPNNVIPIRFTKNQTELAELYSRASVTLLTSKRETFSMVTAESLCCGTPVVGFNAGGPESIGIAKYCKFSEHGNIRELINNINYFLEKNPDSATISEEAHARYSTLTMAQNYYNVYKKILLK